MGITLTERAAAHVKNFLAKGGKEAGIRLGVKTAGCSGYSYLAEPVDSVSMGDTVFECRGVKVVVDAESLPYLAGTELDYVREGLNEGFRFLNPNVKQTCGCGESFNV